MIPSHPAIDRYQTRRDAIVRRRDAECLTRCPDPPALGASAGRRNIMSAVVLTKADSGPGDLSGYGNLAALSLCGWILIGGTAWLFS